MQENSNRADMSLGGAIEDAMDQAKMSSENIIINTPPQGNPTTQGNPPPPPVAVSLDEHLRQHSTTGLDISCRNYVDAAIEIMEPTLLSHNKLAPGALAISSSTLVVEGLHIAVITINKNYHALLGFPVTEKFDGGAYRKEKSAAVILSEVAGSMCVGEEMTVSYELVFSDSYDLVKQRGLDLAKHFKTAMYPTSKITFGMLCGANYYISTDVSVVRDHLNETWSAAVKPRTNIGLSIYTLSPDGGKGSLLARLGGYTTFVEPNNRAFVARPNTVMTSFSSPVPSIELMIFSMLVSAHAFLDGTRLGWVTEYLEPIRAAARAKEKDADSFINIGNLLASEGVIESITEQELTQFIETRLERPHLLSMDIDIGAPRTPQIEKFLTEDISTVINEFFGNLDTEIQNSRVDGNNNPVHIPYIAKTELSVIGSCGGADTRGVADYLALCASNKSNCNAFAVFNARNTSPYFTMKRLGELMPNMVDLSVRYTSYRVCLNFEYLAAMWGKIAHQFESRLTYEDQRNNMNNAGPLPSIPNNVFNTRPLTPTVNSNFAMPQVSGYWR